MRRPSANRSIDSVDLYDLWSEKYRAMSSKRAAYLASIDSQVVESIFSKYRGKTKSLSLLDIGSGDGIRISSIINLLSSEFNIEATLVEPSRNLRKTCLEQIPNAEIISSDFESHDFNRDDNFDIITSLWNVIGHVKDPQFFITKAVHLMSNCSSLYLDANNRYNVSAYGLLNVANNLLKDIAGSGTRRYFELPVDQNTYSKVYIHNQREIKRYFRSHPGIKASFKFINYDNGTQSNFFNGQIYVEAMKCP